MIGTADIPPSFNGNVAVYGFALFGMTLVAAVSLAQIIRIIRITDATRDGWASPVTMTRVIMLLLFSTIFIGVFPDLAIMILWGEISRDLLRGMGETDRLFDGLMLVPFTLAVFLHIKAGNRITEQLIRPPLPTDLFSVWGAIKRQMMMIVVIALLAAGLAIGKAYP